MTNARVQELEQAGWAIEPGDGYRNHIGPLWSRIDGDQKRFGMLTDARHANRFGVVHGGLLLSLADESLGITSLIANGGRRQVTIQLTSQFISSAQVGEFVESHTEVLRLTRTMVFVRGLLQVDDRIILSAEGVWKMLDER